MIPLESWMNGEGVGPIEDGGRPLTWRLETEIRESGYDIQASWRWSLTEPQAWWDASDDAVEEQIRDLI